MDRLRTAAAPSFGEPTRGAVRAAAICWMVSLGLASAAPASAQGPLSGWSDPMQATSSYAAQQEAKRAIPLDKLDADAREKAVSVLTNVTAYRRLPVRVVSCDPRLYALVVCHPDVVVNIWEVLGISQLKLRQTAPETFHVDETEGTSAALQFIYHSRSLHVIYGEWSYSGKLFADPVKGRCLAMLRCSCVRDSDGVFYITNRLDGFISVEPGGVELLTKIFHPLIVKTADANFTQTVAFVGSLSRTAEVNSRGVQRLSAKLVHVEPDVRKELANIAADIGKRAKDADDAAGEAKSPEMAARQAPNRRGKSDVFAAARAGAMPTLAWACCHVISSTPGQR